MEYTNKTAWKWKNKKSGDEQWVVCDEQAAWESCSLTVLFKDLQNVFFELFYVYLERTHPNPEKSSPLKSQRGQKVAFHLLFIQATDMRITSRRKTFHFCFHRKLMLPSGVPKICHTTLFLPNSFCRMNPCVPEHQKASHGARGAGLVNVPRVPQWPAKLRELAWQELPAGSVQLHPGLVETPSLETATHKYVCPNNT